MSNIKYFPDYNVDEYGNVYHTHHYKNGIDKINVIKHKDNGRGYKLVSLWKNNKEYKKYVHRLVAEAFIPNPNNYLEVNHIDGNKDNNNLSNLEWCNRKYNQRHAIENGLKKTKPILKYDINGNFIRKYANFKELKKEIFDIKFSSISKACNNERNTYKGFFWRYENSKLPIIPFEKRKTSKKVKQYDLKGNYIKTWNSVIEATKILNISVGDISKVCNGKRKTASGYIWKYEDDI